ncbi:hypothetical protein CEP54_010071 [Fusarium duplospermum]|uniref:Heterokaryon incompatibility domain-containing protein n=1 Tax=Fusarium duplospermum TaxID=1325734 RepID=A0A428PM15_9HYPO|nr:hypothetical protein CEP54_010071 [Fusarium duplospermum]
MADPAAPFQYTPLSGPKKIRLLILHPARRSSQPIECSFREISLQDNDASVDYEALSYTWGAPRGTQPIRCEGCTILVTPNCEQALLHLRQRFKPRTLWIDAICINQQSTEEKNQQVSMMGDIYTSAIQTILWLGPKTDDGLDAVMRHASRYGNLCQGVRKAYRKIRPDRGLPYGESLFEAPILSPAETERITRVISNPWFLRIWTIQEFLLSKSAVFMMGNLQCPSVCLYTYFCFGKSLINRADMAHFRMRNSLLKLMPLSTNYHYFVKFIVLLIQLSALNNATDPRDKVYGVLAFLKNRWPELDLPVVDYSLSVETVYEQFTRFLITATKRLWPLEITLGSSGPNSQVSASWVLDLNNPDSIFPGYRQKFLPFRREDSTISTPLTAQDTGQLCVRAKNIGTITRISTRMPWDPISGSLSPKELEQERSYCLNDWMAFVTDIDMNHDQRKSPYLFHPNICHQLFGYLLQPEETEPVPDPNYRALRFITKDLNYLRVRQQAEDEVSILMSPSTWDTESKIEKKKRKKRKERKKQAEISPGPFDDHVRWLDRCVLFFTSRGNLATSPGDVRVGDRICVMEGSSSEFIVRREGKGYKLVGRANVYRYESQKAKQQEKWESADWTEDEPGVFEMLLV